MYLYIFFFLETDLNFCHTTDALSLYRYITTLHFYHIVVNMQMLLQREIHVIETVNVRLVVPIFPQQLCRSHVFQELL